MATKTKKVITKDMTMGDIMKKYPDTAMILLDAGLHCVGCGVAGIETLEQGVKGHGGKDKDVEKIVKKINEFIKENY